MTTPRCARSSGYRGGRVVIDQNDNRGADRLDEAIMDAALECFLRAGISHSTLDEIARTSGIDQHCLQQRFATKECLVEAVLARETQHMLAEATTIVTTTD